MSKRSSVSQSRGQRYSMVVGNVEPISSTLGTQLSMQFPAKSPNYKSYHLKENYRTLLLQGQLNSESHLSKQFGNVKEMAKELDTLLQCIKGPGGFRDACTIFQRSSVIELDASLQDITSRFKERKYGGLWQWSEFPNKIAVQSNDTHPTLAIPELTRLLMNDEGLGWDEAWDMTSKVICISHMEIELLCSGDHVPAPKDISNEQIIQLCALHVVDLVHRTEKREEAFKRNKRIVELGVFLVATLESPTRHQGSSFLPDLKHRLLLPQNEAAQAGTRYNVPLMNSLVLYVGMQVMCPLPPSLFIFFIFFISLSHLVSFG
ncbi:hypothetical protein VitviT2T_024620 [Vitis vinifera]|uniref:Alpha-1,4 glucan phosphorylase n=1 Tax=Vitis vinifera TaxID=29760 RepID=A0ABY9DJ31_VITVI|nr:hypothetical protein VitviT2T_024620 [Vitis vinifera]